MLVSTNNTGELSLICTLSPLTLEARSHLYTPPSNPGPIHDTGKVQACKKLLNKGVLKHLWLKIQTSDKVLMWSS